MIRAAYPVVTRFFIKRSHIAPPAVPASAASVSRFIARSLVSRPPGSDPLDLLRQECMARKLCDQDGSRLPGVHWSCAIAVSTPDSSSPPNLRTVGIQRLSSAGIDFILKATSPTAQQLATGQGIAFLHAQGHFLPGESAEQWRGEGTCLTLPLDADLIAILPVHTLTSMIGSLRLEKETTASPADVQSSDRAHVHSRSHLTEVFQRTRMELENGNVTNEELNASVRAFRFRPDRLECMYGGPDTVMWNRWEWSRDTTAAIVGASLQWNEALHLVPH